MAAGLFDANRRTVLDPVPLRLGVVTSANSAGWADFRHELERSGLGFSVRLADVRVQGDQAVRMVSSAIAGLAARTDIDVVVVIRGGGARTDLATFDAEEIALAICRSPLPVLTGLGHEVDRSIADDVAHAALKTPTACAVHLVERIRTHVDRCETAWSAVLLTAQTRIQRADAGIVALAHGVQQRTGAAVVRSDERLASRAQRAQRAVLRRLASADERLTRAGDVVVRRAPSALESHRRTLDGIAARVRLLDPVHVLARGWTITTDESGRVVRDAASLAPGTVLRTRFEHGSATSTVSSIDLPQTTDIDTGEPTDD